MTWLTPSQTGSAVVVVPLLVMAAAVAVAALRIRRAGDGRRVVGPAAVAAVAAVVAVVVEPGNVVPGLLIAFPVGLAGLLLLGRGLFRAPGVVLMGGTAGAFAMAVVATQYATGGTGEWGGRYFAIAIPVAVPVLVLALLRTGRRLPPKTAARALAALVVCSLAMTTMALASHRSRVRASTALGASVARAGVAIGGDRPVVVSTDVILPRLAWDAFDEVRWLVATPDQVAAVVASLRRADVERFGLVTATPERERRRLGRAEVISTEVLDGSALAMLVIDAGP
ncbi:MAG: hypothetical protein M3O23_12025 [Actinomycetota bacterium]|nr:hypothetical protein [Actinomycetota bacterium]